MLSTIEKALFLKTVKLFESMTPEQLKILTNISEEMTFKAGEELFQEGDPADFLYVIVDGEIDIVKNHGDPDQVRLAVLGEKKSFGEMALFGSEGRSASAVASADSTFLAMRKEHLLLLIRENPAISTTIVFQLANIIRDNNRQQSMLEGLADEEPSKGADLRQHFRYTVPGVVDIPALSDDPGILQNISAGGLLLSLSKKPEAEDKYEISVKINDNVFSWDNVEVAWVVENEGHVPLWEVGLSIALPDNERKKLASSLEDLSPDQPSSPEDLPEAPQNTD